MTQEERLKEREIIKYYSGEIQSDPGNFVNYVFRSLAYEFLQEYQLALNDALAVVKLKEDYWKGNYQVAKMYLYLNQTGKAVEMVNKYRNHSSFADLVKEIDQTKSYTQVKPKISSNAENQRSRGSKYPPPSCTDYDRTGNPLDDHHDGRVKPVDKSKKSCWYKPWTW